jgi:flagellar biosynthetic protein FliR
MDGHLLLISALVESFNNLPLDLGIGSLSGMNIAKMGAELFGTGLQLAMPVIAIMLITNMALAVLTRAAPQLNIFGIGFPVTLMVGMLMVALMMPSLADPFQRVIERSISVMEQVLRPEN